MRMGGTPGPRRRTGHRAVTRSVAFRRDTLDTWHGQPRLALVSPGFAPCRQSRAAGGGRPAVAAGLCAGRCGGRALGAGEDHLVVTDIDWERFAPAFALARPRPLLSAIPEFARALEEIAEAGFWRIGLAGDAGIDLKEALGPRQVALVLGAEGAGMRQNTRDHCDALARLPITNAVESLNVSNAAAVALYAATVA